MVFSVRTPWRPVLYIPGSLVTVMPGTSKIPISAQVVSVADVYDALASERVYKKAVPNEKVLEMILHGECGQFNPILIECLQEISSRIRSECYDEEQET